MAQQLYTQTTIAMIWDFDQTLIKGYSQAPLFEHFGVDAKTFWDEVNALQKLFADRGLRVGKDTAYLNHILTYVQEGKFEGLTNSMLTELGSAIPMSDGIPDFLTDIQALVAENDRYSQHDLELEHYVVSTGLVPLIQGSAVGGHVERIWANEFIDQPPPSGYLAQQWGAGDEVPISQVGYMVDNTSKTRAIFEINKGPGVEVNTLMSEDDRRVPIPNMIYIADGPSDVPVFSILMKNGGRCLGVYQDSKNFPGVKQLQDEGRVHWGARADFRPGEEARMWLETTVREVADRICSTRENYLKALKPPAGHVVS